MRRTPRRAGALVTALCLALVAGGCAVNAGSAKADAFERHFEDVPDVAAASAGGTNDLPFVGSATATVEIAPGTSRERVAEIVHLVGEYQHDHSGVVSTVEFDGSSIAVADKAATNDADLALVHALVDTPEVGTVQLLARETVVTAAPGVSFTMLFEDLLRADGPYPVLPDVELSVLDSTGSLEVVSEDGTVPVEPLAAFHAIAAVFPPVGAEISADRLRVRVAHDADRLAARDLALAAAPSVAEGLRVDGGNVERFGASEETDATADLIVLALDGRPGVEWIKAYGDEVVVTVDSLETAQSVAEGLTALAGGTTVRIVSPGTWSPEGGESGYTGPSFDVMAHQGEPTLLSVDQVATLFSEHPLLDEVESGADRLVLDIDEATTRDRAALATAVAPLVAPGTDVSVRSGSLWFSFVAGQPLADEHLDDRGERRAAQDFVDAWDAAAR
ncbi:hypothetical protein [Oerskovia enterophila]|uniref:Lipoprotein LpqB n=1 Tax=Oerskovia enterophila TaxID=43678 RepID=A0A163RTJ0_9CELL|nr:hypothetical protein [Oerskovia enterophila]KZM35682.1 hypothetical protein OJAG_16450 [Oerskovia enterophila]